jgi:predicted N-acetyltransferase YhbS
MIQIRRAERRDARECGRICYEAFRSIASDHNFPVDFPAPQIALMLIAKRFSHPRFYCVVAEDDGRIVGSSCLDERGPIAGLGPITVDPVVQSRHIGHCLMEHVMAHVAEQGFAGARLVQAAYNTRSLALYTKLGFVVRESLACLSGRITGQALGGHTLRRARVDDVEECDRLCEFVHGHTRDGELRDAIDLNTAGVATRNGEIRAYTTDLGFSGHTVARDNDAIKALISGVSSFRGPGILVPMCNEELFRWCLLSGLQIVQPMLLMSVGFYKEPVGAFLPSILY